MILLDTCVLIFDALTPAKLSTVAKRIIEKGEAEGRLACADISLWEIAMLVEKGRLAPGTGTDAFLADVLAARAITVLPINAAIATVSASHPDFQHADPADRLIAATALVHHCRLVTSDARLRGLKALQTVW